MSSNATHQSTTEEIQSTLNATTARWEDIIKRVADHPKFKDHDHSTCTNMGSTCTSDRCPTPKVYSVQTICGHGFRKSEITLELLSNAVMKKHENDDTYRPLLEHLHRLTHSATPNDDISTVCNLINATSAVTTAFTSDGLKTEASLVSKYRDIILDATALAGIKSRLEAELGEEFWVGPVDREVIESLNGVLRDLNIKLN